MLTKKIMGQRSICRGNGFMIENQASILSQIIGIIDSAHPDAVLIAGDVYDKSVSSGESDGILLYRHRKQHRQQ